MVSFASFIMTEFQNILCFSNCENVSTKCSAPFQYPLVSVIIARSWVNIQGNLSWWKWPLNKFTKNMRDFRETTLILPKQTFVAIPEMYMICVHTCQLLWFQHSSCVSSVLTTLLWSEGKCFALSPVSYFEFSGLGNIVNFNLALELRVLVHFKKTFHWQSSVVDIKWLHEPQLYGCGQIYILMTILHFLIHELFSTVHYNICHKSDFGVACFATHWNFQKLAAMCMALNCVIN